MSVAVNDVMGVAGFVTPGTLVDVLVTGAVAGTGQGGQNITRTILENVTVLAAGQKVQQDGRRKAPDGSGDHAAGDTRGRSQPCDGQHAGKNSTGTS